MGYSPVGVERVERYTPAPTWQLGLFEGPTSLVLRKGRRRWCLMIKTHDLVIIPPDSDRIYTTERPVNHFYLEFRYGSVTTASNSVELPAIMPCGMSADAMLRDFAACMELRETDRLESDLLARLLLWRLVRIARTAEAGHQDRAHIIEEVQRRIRENTADASLTPEALAEAVGYSRRRLDQLFAEPELCSGHKLTTCTTGNHYGQWRGFPSRFDRRKKQRFNSTAIAQHQCFFGRFQQGCKQQ